MIAPTPSAGFHHIGAAVTSVDRSSRRLGRLGFELERSFEDPLQGVSGCFVHDGSLRVELLEPLDDDPTLIPWMRGDFNVYQWAYEVPDLEATLAAAVGAGARVVREPRPAVAFDGRPVAFVMIVPGSVIEYIEAEPGRDQR